MNTGSITLHMDRRHEVAPVLIARSCGLSVTFMSRVPLMKSHPSSHAHNGSLSSTPRIAASKGRGGPPAFFNMSPTRNLLPPKAWVTGASVQSARATRLGITCRQADGKCGWQEHQRSKSRLVPLGSHHVGAPWGGTLSTTMNVPLEVYMSICHKHRTLPSKVYVQCGLRRFPHEEFR